MKMDYIKYFYLIYKNYIGLFIFISARQNAGRDVH